MNAYQIVLLGVQALSSLLTVSMIGKPRKPLDNGTAVATLITSAVMCFLIIRAGSNP